MATIAILVREASRWRAVTGTLLVLAAMVTAEVLGWPSVEVDYREWKPDPTSYVFGAGILLVLAIGTGLYFRARDNERTSQLATSVAAARTPNGWRWHGNCTTWWRTT